MSEEFLQTIDEKFPQTTTLREALEFNRIYNISNSIFFLLLPRSHIQSGLGLQLVQEAIVI